MLADFVFDLLLFSFPFFLPLAFLGEKFVPELILLCLFQGSFSLDIRACCGACSCVATENQAY